LVVSGCGYRVGPTVRSAYADVKKIDVPTVINKTFEPNVQSLITDTIINRFNNDGTFEITGQAQADATLSITINEIDRTPLRFATSNSLVTQEYQLTIRATYELKSKSGKMLNSFSAQGITTFFVSNDLIASQRQAIPLAAESLANDIVSQISEAW